jgi:prepilin-type N-terminal cleavage/methylation domain-containing protein
METIRIKARSGSAGAASLSRPIKARRGSAGTPSARRSAFTLVELLVVIGIIAMLAALVTPAVMRAQATARNAAIKAEIDMLHMAIMNYKNEYGSFPPCSDSTSYSASGPAVKHLARLFPRCASPTGQFSGSPVLTPQNAIAAWLGGYSDDPSLPLTGGTRKKLYDFDQSRTSSLSYFPSGKPGSPYIYIDSANYTTGSGAATTIPTSSLTGGTYFAHRVPTSAAGNFTTLTQPAFNADTFQILCAGRDEEFGTDDDLSNFWPSTRKDYIDSLSQ